MAFKSLLFVNGESIKEDKEAINDLRINFILDGIVDCSIESVKDKVKEVLYRRLLDKNDILFRQSTLEDIETEEVHNSINTFSNRISKIERLLELSKKSNFEITKHGWFLEAVITYIRSLDDLNSNLAKFDLKSEGLREFAGYLKSYLNSDYFTNLKDKSKTIKEKLGNITFNVTIKENRIYVNRYNDEKDLNNDIQQLFERLASEEIESIEPEIIESNILSNVEEKILEFVKKLNPEIFEELREFYMNSQNFFDTTIRQFYEECQLYLSFLSYIEPLEKKGLEFCYPEIMERGERIECEGGFDLALAKQLSESEENVVTNDFYLDRNEKMFLISGPNQGGKTTFARMFGQIFYFALLGLKVPGSKASIFICDRILTHFEKEEKVENKKGKLEDELLRAKLILESATENSVIILNEIFSATSLEDAYFLAEYLIKKIIKIGAIAVFVTFMHKLSGVDDSIVPMTSTVDPKNPVIRTFKILRRKSLGKSFAVYLAQKYCLTYECLRERLKRK